MTEVRIWMTEIQIWTTNFMAPIYFANLNDSFESFLKWNDKSAKLTGTTYIKFNGFVENYSAFSTYSCIRYYEFFKLSELLGGGGGPKRYVCPPPIFSLVGGGGRLPPLPPQDRRLCISHNFGDRTPLWNGWVITKSRWSVPLSPFYETGPSILLGFILVANACLKDYY